MIKIIIIFLLCPILLLSQKHIPPTTIGINEYVKNNDSIVIKNFENFFGVQIQQMFFETDNLQDYSLDTNQLGIYFPSMDLAVISNEEKKYKGYTLENIKKRRLKRIKENNFVRSVMIHELCHNYINELINNAPCIDASDNKFTSLNEKDISKEYKKNPSFNSEFIEEGICEYSSITMGGLKIPKDFIPKTIEELLDSTNNYKMKYKYSVYFVEKIFENYDLTTGIILIIKNSPPTNDEILDPKKYYDRIISFVDEEYY